MIWLDSTDMTRLNLFLESCRRFSVLFIHFLVYDNIVSGIRKKLDVCKILIENTRELMTEESRRAIIIESLKKLDNSH